MSGAGGRLAGKWMLEGLDDDWMRGAEANAASLKLLEGLGVRDSRAALVVAPRSSSPPREDGSAVGAIDVVILYGSWKGYCCAGVGGAVKSSGSFI